MSTKNQVDFIVRRLLLFSKLFTNSWGKPTTLTGVKHVIDNYLSKGEARKFYEGRAPAVVITKEWQSKKVECVDGYFTSPLALSHPEIYPSADTQICHFRGHFIRDLKQRKGLMIILAPTGDHTYTLRERSFVSNLHEHGISSVLIENPFYGRRKPKDQFRSALMNVSDLFVMGASLIVECNFLFRWLYEQGHYPFGLAGVSLGGYTAGLAATNAEFPVTVIPCLSWTTAAPVYTRGALADSIGWENLAKELQSIAFLESVAKIPNCDWLDKLNDGKDIFGLDQTRKFMWILMDQFTSLEQYPVIKHPELSKFVIAENDAYIEREGAPHISDIWPGSQVISIPDVGHVLGFINHQAIFRKTIVEMLEKAGKIKF